MYGICMEYVMNINMYGICMEYQWNIYEIFMQCVWTTYGICMEQYVICMGCAWNILLYIEYVWDMD